MNERLKRAAGLLKERPALRVYEIHAGEGELHLTRNGERFIRLIPRESEGLWRMEYFHNLEEWRVVDFTGTLEECLDYLADYPHFRFWQG